MIRSLLFFLVTAALAANSLRAQLTLPNQKPIVGARMPALSPDGKRLAFVYRGDIWTVASSGGRATPLTQHLETDAYPLFSPDGKWIAFLTFGKEIDPTDHPYYKQVYLRLMPIESGAARVIGYVYGGQGTLNVPSWSPDSRKLAFVSNSNLE